MGDGAVAGFFKRRRYQQDVLAALNAIMYLYPRGVDNILVDFPNIKSSIDIYEKKNDPTAKAAVFIASVLLAHLIEGLRPEEREVIRSQIASFNFKDFRHAMKERMAGRNAPLPDVAYGTLMIAMALIVVEGSLKSGAIDKDTYDMLLSDISGALKGQALNERSSERIHKFMDETFDVPIIKAGDEDTTEVLPSERIVDLPQFSGTDTKVMLVPTATGIALVRADNHQQVTERRSLKQEDLEKVPLDNRPCTFVNFHSHSDGIQSCIIAGEDSQVYGSMRAFWWSLARVNVVNTDRKATGYRMTRLALATVHTTARTMWDVAIENAGSIDYMRDMLVLLRNQHLEVISKLITEATNEATKLGLEIALAMVLATQSEDDKLERFAFERFRRFLWQPGEEPPEFYLHG